MMPKAKVKTKGVAQPNCLKEELSDEVAPTSLSQIMPASDTGNPPAITEVMQVSIATESNGLEVTDIKKPRKVMQKKISQEISKSKQLKIKKLFRKKATTRQTLKKNCPLSEFCFDSDDDQPLVSTTNCTIKNASAAICDTNSPNSTTNTEQIVNKVYNKDDNNVRKRKRSQTECARTETDISQHTQYTSIMKGESLLVIKKQYPPEEDDDCSPTKKIKHSIDNILSGHTEVDFDVSKQLNASINEDECDRDSATNSHKNFATIDQVLDRINPQVLKLSQSECEINNEENSRTELDNIDNMDSDKTEPYEYSALSPVSTQESRGRSFSPIPSTSKDNAIFKKNDIRFQESLRLDDDVEIIEPHLETIIVEDGSPGDAGNETIDITASDPPVDDDIEFIGYSRIPNFKGSEIDEILGNKYGACDVNSSDCEIVDVDDVIAEGSLILQRHKRKNLRQTVITNAVTSSPALADQPIDLSPLNFMSLPASTSASPILVDFLEPLPRGTTSFDPVMASTSLGKKRVAQQEPDYDGIIGNYFKNNPVPQKKLTVKNVCSTLGNILDQMTSILGSNNTQRNNDTREEPINVDSSLIIEPRQNIMRVNNCGNRFDDLEITETAILDELNGVLPLTNMEPYYQHKKPPSYVNNYVSKPCSTMVTANPVNISKQTCQFQTPSVKPPTLVTPEPLPSTDRGFGRLMECPICMENFGSRPLASTICGHIFCMACIQKALSAPDGKKCPTCRKSFKKRGQSYHPLFL